MRGSVEGGAEAVWLDGLGDDVAFRLGRIPLLVLKGVGRQGDNRSAAVLAKSSHAP